MKKCLITGCEGFLGSHLADFLLEKGHSVYATVFGETQNISHLDGKITVYQCDMKDKTSVHTIINEVKPDIIFHLAAQSYVMVSWENPEETLKSNVMGSFYLLDAIKLHSPDAKTIIVGSSSVYGPRSEQELPLGEETSFLPTSMYGVSKVAEECLGYLYSEVFGLNVIRVRPFNMTGPRKLYDACSDFSKEIVEIEKGIRDEIEVGNLETTRDFTDRQDAVKALWLIAEKAKPGELYNLCSGKGWKMKDILEKLISLSGKEIGYRVVTERMRPSDDPIYVGDNSKLRALGWEPQVPMDNTLKDMLNYWREQL